MPGAAGLSIIFAGHIRSHQLSIRPELKNNAYLAKVPPLSYSPVTGLLSGDGEWIDASAVAPIKTLPSVSRYQRVIVRPELHPFCVLHVSLKF